MYQKVDRLFKDKDLDKARLLVQTLKPSCLLPSKVALKLIDGIGAEQLAKDYALQTQMAYINCILGDEVPKTLGTQCLVYLFDPGNGWIRDSTKRGDMLIMAAKLVAKGVKLEGLSYYGISIQQTIQGLINDRNDHPAATLNDELVQQFKAAGYEFTYPDAPNGSNVVEHKGP